MVEAISLSALPKDISELAGLSPHYPFNEHQASCEYQILKFFGLTRPGNRTQVYRLSGVDRLRDAGNGRGSVVVVCAALD